MSEEKIGQHYLAALHQAFPGVVLDEAWQTKDQLTITVKVNYLPEVVEFLYYQQGGWLSVLFGNDERKLNGHYAVYYVLSMEQGTKCWITVRVEVDANKPEYPSVTPRVPAAVWGEREVRDMYGLVPVGLPDERRLVLPDDWPDELYPLRKDSMDYRQRPAPTTDAETYEFINELGSKKKQRGADWPAARHLLMNLATSACSLTARTLSTPTTACSTSIAGWKSWRKPAWGYNEVTFLSDRVCGICGFAHSTAYTTSVENAMGIVVPERAQMIRAILLEVERLHSHLLNLGLACHFTGFDSGFMQFFRVRETSMKMAEILTGARKTYGLNLIGGIPPRPAERGHDPDPSAGAADAARRAGAGGYAAQHAEYGTAYRRYWPSGSGNRPRLQQRRPDGARQRPRPRHPRRPPVCRLRPAADGSSQRTGLRRDISPQGADQRGLHRAEYD